jgi:predicted dehydrogenase
MSDGVRLGVIGVGDVAGRDYLPEIGRLEPEAIVVAVAGAGPERVGAVAERLGVTPHVGYASLLADDEVDAVLNLTPAKLHEEVNAAALDAGKHVYSEKPLAMTAEAARVLGAAATTRGLVLAAAPSVLVYPQIEIARVQIATGGLGPPVAASSAMFGGVPPWEGFASDPTPYFEEGIGPLVDIGVYPLHALTGLLGPVRRVGAVGRRTRDAFDVADGPAAGRRIAVEEDDLSILTLEFAKGALATVQSSFASAAGAEPELEVLGERGAVACSLFDPTSPVRVSDGSDWKELTVPAERADGPDHILGVRHLVRCIDETERPLLTAQHAAHVLDVIEAARRSTAEHRFVEVADHGWTPEEGAGT